VSGTAVAPSRRMGMAAWRGVAWVGLIGAALSFYLCIVGIVPIFGERPLIAEVISLGQTALALTALLVGYLASRRAPAARGPVVLSAGALAGLLTGGSLSLLILLSHLIPVRSFLPNASPALFDIVTIGAGAEAPWVPALVGAGLGLLGAGLLLLPGTWRRLIALWLGGLLLVGLFSGLVRTPMLAGPLAGLARDLFASQGLTDRGAVLTLVVIAAAFVVQERFGVSHRVRAMPLEQRRTAALPMSLVLLLIILWVPLGLGPFVAQAVALIALYILMGLGLNITLGLAGLLDLGFVAFFAVGAYTVGLLTSQATGVDAYAIAQLPFWIAMPIAVLAAMGFGVLLGLPILGIRGDYLAIATLGFGEIIHILAKSDLLKPLLGGPRGVLNVPKPIEVAPTDFLAGPNQIYYISLICAAVIAFVAWRLRGSRIGRAWLAIREDEDVAEALGVNLVQTKVLAYMLGAAFAGLGGAIFASLVGAVFPSSINLFVSINAVAIVVVGGMGSIPGVALGAIVLIGLPELFREFQEYRFLFYGLVLMLMMRFRPAGLLPSRIGQRELAASAGTGAELAASPSPGATTGAEGR
jgi:branched-chain amino acid transport system permease protein